MAKRVFISYRRDDTAAVAGRVYDHLCLLLGKSNVFFDVSAIGGGENFSRRIAGAIETSDAVLAFIGRKWLESSGEGDKPRIFNPEDYVRAELRAALKRPILLLPILVEGAQMPGPAVLPEEVRDLATRNALPLRHETFDDDTENIVRTILGITGKERPWENKGRWVAKLAYAIVGALAALVILTIVAALYKWQLGRPIPADIGNGATQVLIISGAFLGAWGGFALQARQRRKSRLKDGTRD